MGGSLAKFHIMFGKSNPNAKLLVGSSSLCSARWPRPGGDGFVIVTFVWRREHAQGVWKLGQIAASAADLRTNNPALELVWLLVVSCNKASNPFTCSPTSAFCNIGRKRHNNN